MSCNRLIVSMRGQNVGRYTHIAVCLKDVCCLSHLKGTNTATFSVPLTKRSERETLKDVPNYIYAPLAARDYLDEFMY